MAEPEGETDRDWLSALVEEVQRSSSVHYRAVAAALRGAIATEQISVGAQLPAQRELARLLGIGRTSIVEAYNLLRAESLLRSRQGAGTWVVRRPDGAVERCST